MAQPSINNRERLADVPTDAIPGIPEQSVGKLQAIGLGDLLAILTAMKTHNGDFRPLGQPGYKFGLEESKRLGDAVLAYAREHFSKKRPVKDLKDFEYSYPPDEAEDSEDDTAEDAGGSFWNRLGFAGFSRPRAQDQGGA